MEIWNRVKNIFKAMGYLALYTGIGVRFRNFGAGKFSL
jgi:hypothetical protein